MTLTPRGERLSLALAAAALVGGFVGLDWALAGTAHADTGKVEVAWLMPGGPHQTTYVFPQSYAPQPADPCRTFQVDTYDQSTAAYRDALAKLKRSGLTFAGQDNSDAGGVHAAGMLRSYHLLTPAGVCTSVTSTPTTEAPSSTPPTVSTPTSPTASITPTRGTPSSTTTAPTTTGTTVSPPTTSISPTPTKPTRSSTPAAPSSSASPPSSPSTSPVMRRVVVRRVIAKSTPSSMRASTAASTRRSTLQRTTVSAALASTGASHVDQLGVVGAALMVAGAGLAAAGRRRGDHR